MAKITISIVITSIIHYGISSSYHKKVQVAIDQEKVQSKRNSCIEIYAHSCLKPFSIGRKPCSNSKTHVQIMKFTCRLNMGFGRRHWSMRRDVMCFVLNKMADVEEAPRVR